MSGKVSAVYQGARREVLVTNVVYAGVPVVVLDVGGAGVRVPRDQVVLLYETDIFRLTGVPFEAGETISVRIANRNLTGEVIRLPDGTWGVRLSDGRVFTRDQIQPLVS